MYSSMATEPVARAGALAALLEDLVELKGQRLVIESREMSQDATERRQIAAAIRAGKAPKALVYDHMRGHEEPMLWVADAAAWAYGARGEWRSRVASLVDNVRDLQ